MPTTDPRAPWRRCHVERHPLLLSSEPRPCMLGYDALMVRSEDDEEDHPERPERILDAYEECVQQGLVEQCQKAPTVRATRHQLVAAHSPEYVDSRLAEWQRCETVLGKGKAKAVAKLRDLLQEEGEKKYESIDFMNEFTVDCALVSCGITLQCVDAVVSGRCASSAALVRPPGHHAERGCAKGFCHFNNVAVAAAVELQRDPLARVLVVDWDVHHGNGTQHIFDDDKRVCYFSAHRHDGGEFYPGTCGGSDRIGKGNAKGFSINCGWNGQGPGDREFADLWTRLLLPVAREFDPTLVIVSAGFDAARGDPLGGCDLTPHGYAALTKPLLDLAGGKCVVVLEGGYNTTSVARSFAAVVGVLLGAEADDLAGFEPPRTRFSSSVDKAIKAVKPFWKSLQAAPVPVAVPPPPPPPAASTVDDAELAAASTAPPPPSQPADDASLAASLASLGIGDGATLDLVGDASPAPAPAPAEFYQVEPHLTCPHANAKTTDWFAEGDSRVACKSCGGLDELWTCLTCGTPGCSRYQHGHGVEHFEATGHPIAISHSDLSIHCHECDLYLDGLRNPLLREAYSSVHRIKFGDAPKLPEPAVLPGESSSRSGEGAA